MLQKRGWHKAIMLWLHNFLGSLTRVYPPVSVGQLYCSCVDRLASNILIFQYFHPSLEEPCHISGKKPAGILTGVMLQPYRINLRKFTPSNAESSNPSTEMIMDLQTEFSFFSDLDTFCFFSLPHSTSENSSHNSEEECGEWTSYHILTPDRTLSAPAQLEHWELQFPALPFLSVWRSRFSTPS